MSHYFLDSSAVVKRYANEIGSNWIRTIIAPGTGFSVILCEITQAEVTAALARTHRAGNITQADRDTLVSLFLRHCQIEYDLVPVTRQIIHQAVVLNQQHKLRGYDSVQLAAALEASIILRHSVTTPVQLTFVAADADLLAAANLEGLVTENPLNHP